MADRVRYVPDGRVLNLSALRPDDYVLITSLHGSITRTDGLVLECLNTGGDRAMYIWRDGGGRYWARHFAGGGHGTHPVVPESPEHRRQKEYWARAAQGAGLTTETEYSTGKGTRLDICISGGLIPTGIEVQRSKIAAGIVKARTTKSFRAGYLVAWFNENGPRPSFLTDVPALGCNALPWSEHLPRPREAIATGLVHVKAARCVVGAFQRCPEGATRPCGRFHPTPEPWRGLTVDDAATMIPHGQMVPLGARNGVHLVAPDSFARYQELTDGLGAWVPGGRLQMKATIDNRPPAPCVSPAHETESPLSRDQPFLTYLRRLPGRCSSCGFHIKTQGHNADCQVAP